ncbi:MAG: peptidylprolyl isomerase [Nitrososphaeraceae archaeon]
MISGSKTIFKVNSFEFQIKHLLVILVLVIAFSTAFTMRSYPIKYGFVLNEFDPYFDYRATKYLLDNGISEYLNWHDTMSWYPDGRDVPKTSQVGLHIIAAGLFQIFGLGSSLLDFVIMFPVVIGSLTTIVIFALVRLISNSTTAGMFASLLFAFMPAIIQRGNLGWFKSEPLGLFLGLISTYLFLSALKHDNLKLTVIKMIGAGIILGLANSSWGGIQYFSIPLAIFFFALPFVKNNTKIIIYGVTIFTIVTLITVALTPRPGLSFVFGLPGIALMIGTVFAIVGSIVRRKSKIDRINRNLVITLGIFILIAVSIIIAGAYQPSSFRYMNAINPLLSTQNPLVESVAEHSTPTLVDYFSDYSILIIFSGFGILMAFKKRNDMAIFALILGITGMYVSATFARLMVFSSISIVILSSIGIFEITRSILQYKAERSNLKITEKEFKKKIQHGKITPQVKPFIQVGYVVVVIFLISIPVLDQNGILFPLNYNWISAADIPPSIANGATGFRMQVTDWIDTFDWISENTPKESVIASWWDYGYWITTLGERTSLADNATINQTRIQTIAQMLMSNEEEGIKIAKDLQSDYILLYVVADRLPGNDGTNFYTLGSGGDESKKQWFMRIGGFDENLYVERDGFTPTTYFWNNTLLGKLIPFTPVSYASINNGGITGMSPEYVPGSIGFYMKDIKYPNNDSINQPLKLVYASPSFENENDDIVFGIFLYEINKNYEPKINEIQLNDTIKNNNNTDDKIIDKDISKSIETIADMTSSNELAIIQTSQGNITIEFFPNAAPKHVSNFLNLAEEGFYDGTIFHRIIKEFMIQGGDPNSKTESNRQIWGTGGPNHTIDAEFNDIPHERGILSMARSSDPNSAGSQFFIVTKDSRFLDNQYTVFGKVIEGMDIVDKIENLITNENDQPKNYNDAQINKITIEKKE